MIILQKANFERHRNFSPNLYEISDEIRPHLRIDELIKGQEGSSIRKPYFGGNRALDDLKNFSKSEKLAFCSLTILYKNTRKGSVGISDKKVSLINWIGGDFLN
ncbi:hypothetical protein BBF96_01195 [Anoxybacter fermentans]|uniref:Uncharacterized protein n=1 Tax=Anoxybacter fermentans TaxID=1323375 RepID=A0A3S9SV19_9FIRM|nr:hypothetical protein BBF96_01195 [Anoxybacter fermentans]